MRHRTALVMLAVLVLSGCHRREITSLERKEAANVLSFDAEGWLATGDLGVIHEENLYITGRAKEIIFINGQNYYPYDLENIATRAPGLDLNKVVAAGVARVRKPIASQSVVLPATGSRPTEKT